MIFFTDWKEEGTSITHRITFPISPILQITPYLQEVSILILFSLSINHDEICNIRNSVQQMKKINLLSPTFFVLIFQADKSNLQNLLRKVKIQILSVRKRHRRTSPWHNRVQRAWQLKVYTKVIPVWRTEGFQLKVYTKVIPVWRTEGFINHYKHNLLINHYKRKVELYTL